MVQSKPKGNSYENVIATKIRKHFVPAKFEGKTAHNLVHRTPMSGGHVEKGDIIIKPPILKWFPWFIECRNRESWSWKNVMEKGRESVIGTWFWEDAEEKCHAYDHDASYPRYPLLVFTKNFEKNYFCAEIGDFIEVLFTDVSGATREDIMLALNPSCLWIGRYWVIGRFSTLMVLHNNPPEAVAQGIHEYLGESNE
jgi:hypothetical protein